MRKILIDTQVLIWISEEQPEIKKSWLELIQDSDNRIFVSIASFWEIAIKISIGKLKTNIPLNGLFEFANETGIEILNIEQEAIEKVQELPFHHNDPFDRIIISQAISNKLELMSSDNQFSKYDIVLIN